jgi:hypothetical protein
MAERRFKRIVGPLLRQAPVRRENLSKDFALHAVQSAGLRQEAGNLTIDFRAAWCLERVNQMASRSLEPGADAVCDWRRAIATYGHLKSPGGSV